LPQVQKGTKKDTAKDKSKVIERVRLSSIFEDDTLSQMKDAILDIITPLESQDITSITFKQIIDQLQTDPTFQGIQISDDLISQSVEDLSGVSVAPDPANNNEMTLTFDSGSQSAESVAQTDSAQNKVDSAATRQATKNLGEPDGIQ
jgi:hypothetical protein